jgi:hypothetical protein
VHFYTKNAATFYEITNNFCVDLKIAEDIGDTGK